MQKTLYPIHSRLPVMILSIIMSIRMLGLFMILPVLSLYASHFADASATLIGVALGMYGLTQAIFQIPLGLLSDCIGRKQVIVLGLILLCLGSVVAALSHSMTGLIIGRALQGTGALGSTVLAFVADLTRDESRGKAMAFIGLAIGSAFTLAMIMGPALNHWLQLSGIFWITAGLALFGMFLLLFIPTAPKPLKNSETSIVKRFTETIRNKSLWQLNVSIGALHAILTALFIAIPIVLTRRHIGLTETQQIIFYFSVLVASFMVALPLIIYAERKRHVRAFFIGAVTVIMLTQFIFIFSYQALVPTIVLLFIFFAAFTLLEALLPSLVSKMAPLRNKGAAMGIYSSTQFFGIFVGGLLGGFVFSHAGLIGIFAVCAIIALAWLQFTIAIPSVPYFATVVLRDQKVENLLAIESIPGVTEVAHVPSEHLLYVKIDKRKISEPELRNAIEAGKLALV